MIASEGKARQQNTYHMLRTRRAFFDMKVASEKVNTEFFNNYEFSKTRFKSVFWNILPYIIEALLYVFVMAYLFSWKTTFVAYTPAAGIVGVVFVYIRLSNYHIRKKYKQHHHKPMAHIV